MQAIDVYCAAQAGSVLSSHELLADGEHRLYCDFDRCNIGSLVPKDLYPP